MEEALKSAGIIVADPLYRPICPGDSIFYELPHVAFSGRIYFWEYYCQDANCNLRWWKIYRLDIRRKNKEIIRKSLKTMPSVIILFSLVYSMISLKLVRNYLNYKDESMRDLKNIKGLRIELKDLIVIFGFLAISILLSKFFSLSNEFIILNSIMSLKFIFGINGILILVYLVSSKRSGISKIINWILIFLLFTYTSEIIAIIGFIDVFVNFRKKVRIGWKKSWSILQKKIMFLY